MQDLFHHVLYNDKDEAALSKRVKSLVPIWCGLTSCINIKEENCTCAVCVARRDGVMPDIEDILIDLKDLMDEEWSEDDE
jgi:hypothetical protein